MKAIKYLFLLLIVFNFNILSQKNDTPIEVKANVLVTDEKGNPVDDVKSENIKVFEDGVEQKITYFAKKEPVLNLAMVFDNSGSVKYKFNEIISAGKVIVANLRDQDQAFVVRFVSNSEIEMVQEFSSNKKDLSEAIDNLFIAGGQSAILDALYVSAEKLLEREKNDKTKRYAIILFSDAEERDSYYKLDDVMKMFKGNDLQVFILSYANFAPSNKKDSLKLSNILSLQTGGTTYVIPPKYKDDDLITFLKAIVYELRSQYIISYTSTNQLRDGKPRKLTLNITDNEKGEKRNGYIREGFTVPKK